ncbi:MAG: hypothetical protein IKV77_02350 [Alistipes sp.]|nr:hypothetical protein [Alistipes sp.]
MKKIIILVVIAWVGLSTYPTYANRASEADPIALLKGGLQGKNKEEKIQILNDVDSLFRMAESLGKTWVANKASGKISENQFKEIKENRPQLQAEIDKVKEELKAAETTATPVSTDPVINATDNLNKSNLGIFEYVVVGVLSVILLIIVFMLYLLRKLKNEIDSIVYENIEELRIEINANASNINKCKEIISGLKLKISELEGNLNTLLEEYEKAKALEISKQKEVEEAVVTPPSYQEKIWYGEFKKDEGGMPERLMKEDKKGYSQFKIIQISDDAARYSILTEISKDSLAIAQDACAIDGDIGYYDTIEMVEDGRLELCDDVWRVIDRVKIKLNKN